MIISLKDARQANAVFSEYSERLRHFFSSMDQHYNRTAEYYGFDCKGCLANCCRTRFYHHTYLEFFFMNEGFGKLAPEQRQEIKTRSKDVLRQTAKADKKGKSVGLMCPLNSAGLCVLYSYRPMICRLHGIPHQLQKPGQNVIYGPGCGTFYERCSAKPYFKFDRTLFYFEMAQLENEFKQAAGLMGKIKLTIADMITGSAKYLDTANRNGESANRGNTFLRFCPLPFHRVTN